MHMKRVFLLFSTLLAVLSTIGCTREEMDAPSVPQMIIRATIPGDSQTKASFSDRDGGGLTLSWQEHDNILVEDVDDETNCAVYEILPGFTKTVAHFSGDELTMGDVFNVICPGTRASSLTQTGNGNLEHLVFNAKLEGVAREYLADIAFNSEWADDHGCSFYRGGVIKLVLNLPASVKAPKKVELAFFNGDTTPEESLALNIAGVNLATEHVLTAYLQSSWGDGEGIEFSDFTLKVTDGDGSCYTSAKAVPGGTATLMAGCQNIMDMRSSSLSFHEELFAGGDGTRDNPYLIANAKHLDNMHAEGILKAEQRVYFRLIRDIDMQAYLQTHTWLPLNSLSPYDKLIDFDGDGHTIDHFSCSFDATGLSDATHDAASKPSFFGLLYGSCYDVNFTHAVITTNYGPAGILGGFVGYSAKKAVVYNVHVQGTVTKNGGLDNKGDSGVGGLAGRIAFAFIDSCSADVTINCTVQAYVGGLFGIDFADASRVRNCWTSGVIHGDQRVGGIAGGLMRPETAIINCYSTATVDALRCGGGIAGHCNLDNNTAGTPETLMPDNVFRGDIAWQTSFATRTQNKPNGDYWSSGAVVAYTARKNYLTNCYRHPNLSYADYANVFSLYDQENATPASPLSITNPNTDKYTHYYPYHGKAAGSTRLSTVAQGLGWDSSVWNFSEDTPALTGAVEAEPAGEEPASGQSSVESLSVSQGSLARAFPGTTSARGSKSATQDGITWTVEQVAPGIRYFHASGTVTPTWMDDGKHRQSLYVVDYDLSNPDYEVKIVHCSPACVLSQVFEATGAVAAINAGYEIAAIAVKAKTQYTWEKADATKENNVLNNIKPGSEKVVNYPSGTPKSYMPNNTIGDTGVENWKSEGTFYCNGKRDVRIGFDGYAGGATDKYGTNTYNKTIQQERLWYKLGTENEAGFVSSAPILDANYVRFGYTYKNRCGNVGGSQSNSEHPKVHQTGAYPRTAVAIAYPDDDTHPHLLLIVVDGRYADSASGGGYGYSAYWLERHIANAFGPKYMLNLDGGGSTTMCVAGQGDSNTHVVNYPSDNNGATGSNGGGTDVNHAGQRARDTFICIVPAN